MNDAQSSGASQGDGPAPADLQALFETEPGVGFSIVDEDGVVRFANDRAAELFLRAEPEEVVGRSLEELFGPEWAAERLEVLGRISQTHKPAIIRHIRHGRRIQSTIRCITEEDDDGCSFVVVTVEGEHEPSDPEEFEIVESKLAHLGPLEPLTRREIEVLALIGHGMSTAEIARALHRSPRTIENHCDSLRQKLRTANRVQLAEFARRAGLRVEDANLKRI
jgi:DNA-binding CsgD family transcriptional regulator